MISLSINKIIVGSLLDEYVGQKCSLKKKSMSARDKIGWGLRICWFVSSPYPALRILILYPSLRILRILIQQATACHEQPICLKSVSDERRDISAAIMMPAPKVSLTIK